MSFIGITLGREGVEAAVSGVDHLLLHSGYDANEDMHQSWRGVRFCILYRAS